MKKPSGRIRAEGIFATRRCTEPELAADVVDLVKTFQKILDQREESSHVFDVAEENVTVSQMIDYMRRRLALEDRPVRLKQLLRNLNSRAALVCAFLAILELDPLAGGAGATGQRLWRDHAQEAHELR